LFFYKNTLLINTRKEVGIKIGIASSQIIETTYLTIQAGGVSKLKEVYGVIKLLLYYYIVYCVFLI